MNSEKEKPKTSLNNTVRKNCFLYVKPKGQAESQALNAFHKVHLFDLFNSWSLHDALKPVSNINHGIVIGLKHVIEWLDSGEKQHPSQKLFLAVVSCIIFGF